MGLDTLTLLFKLLCEVFFTLAVISFLYRDNPIYKFAEHFFVGVAAGYWIVLQWHTVFMPKLWTPLVYQGILADQPAPGGRLVPLLLLVPGLLGMLMFSQFSKNQSWLARWPMAIVIGSFSGAAVTGFASGDFIPQIQANLLPIIEPGTWSAFVAADGFQDKFFALLNLASNPILIVGVICCLVYFFFSKEHRGATGAAATVGIWFLMISFGASYGRTVATRVSLYLERAVFLFRESTVIGGHEIAHWQLTLVMGLAMIAFLVVWFRVLKRGDPTGA